MPTATVTMIPTDRDKVAAAIAKASTRASRPPAALMRRYSTDAALRNMVDVMADHSYERLRIYGRLCRGIGLVRGELLR